MATKCTIHNKEILGFCEDCYWPQFAGQENKPETVFFAIPKKPRSYYGKGKGKK
jgi:hypothetical protein